MMTIDQFPPDVRAAFDEWKRLDAIYEAGRTPERERAMLAAWYHFDRLKQQAEEEQK